MFNKVQIYVAKVGLANVEHDTLSKYSDEYSQILQKTSEDHENVDFFYYRFRRRPKPPVRMTIHDDEFKEAHGPLEVWTPQTRQLVLQKIESKYIEGKQKFREDQKQHVMARFNRWVNVYFSFVWFVVMPPLVMPALYVMYLNQPLVLRFVQEKLASAEQIYLVASISFFLCAVIVQAVRGMLEDRDPRYWVNFAATVATVFGMLYIAALQKWLPHFMLVVVTLSAFSLLRPIFGRAVKMRARRARLSQQAEEMR